ncbi:MAG: HepT-like ribonuclease domain-containing protein [Nanoarchaeota archaeon]
MSNSNLYKNTILEMIKRLESSLTNKEKFMSDSEMQDATLMRLQVIGENIKNIPLETKKKNSQFKWKKFEKLRNLISHKYNSVDYEIVWNFIKNNLAELKDNLEKII